MDDNDPRTLTAPPRRGGLAGHAGVVGAFTLLSRVTGLVRDTVFAHLFGATHFTDAFLMAFTIPNTFRKLVAEGSLTVAFLPVFNEAQRRGGEAAARRMMSQGLAIFPSLSAVLTALCIVFAEPLVQLFASGFSAVPGKLELTILLTRWMFPFIVLISFVALAMGGLNARRRFAASAAAPLLFNLVHIVAMVTLGRTVDPPMLGVAIGVLLGGAAQAALQLVALRRAGLAFRPSFACGPETRRVLRLMLPAVAALAVYQVNLAALRLFASFLDEAAVTYLYNADRFVQLPLGVFAIAIATASLPAFSDAQVEEGTAGLVRALSHALRLTSFIIVPSAVGLGVLALPIIATVFQHGLFDHVMAQHTAHALIAYVVGLPAVSGIRIAGQAFFAMKDTRTPVACGVIGLATNLAMAPYLAVHFDFVGLAASVSVAAWLQLAVQLFFLRRRVGRLGMGSMLVGLLRDVVAAAPMAAVAVYAVDAVGGFSAGTTLANVMVLAALVVGGVVLYVATQAALRSPELNSLLRKVLRRTTP